MELLVCLLSLLQLKNRSIDYTEEWFTGIESNEFHEKFC